jgi:beta-carotene/zeaxanthin 4-ketolase
MNCSTFMPQKSIVYPVKISFNNSTEPYRGIYTATAIITVWAVSLFFLMNINVQTTNILVLFIAVLWQTFLYTGLFITAHDAMHGAVIHHHPKLNHFIGFLALFLFGALSYKTLLQKHWLHHQQPATLNDPDFHNGKHKNLIAWYLNFMKGYWSWKQMIIITIVYNSFRYLLHIPAVNLNYFWVVSSLLSSLQLFYFGTFEPHTEPSTGYTTPHHTRTISRPVWLSFITCYHFGYHDEHHRYPDVAWWQLPKVHQLLASQLFVDVNIDMQEDQEVVQVQ